MGCQRPRAGSTVLSGAGNDDEINSNSHCQRLSSRTVPFQSMDMFYISGFLLFMTHLFCGSSEVDWGDGFSVLEDSGDYRAVETNTDTTEPGLPMSPAHCTCGKSCYPHNREKDYDPILQMKSRGSERPSNLPNITQLVLSTECLCLSLVPIYALMHKLLPHSQFEGIWRWTLGGH